MEKIKIETLIIDSATSFVVFDLDDTLYNEEDFLLSAYRHIANLLEVELCKNIYFEMESWYKDGSSTFDKIIDKYSPNMSICEMVSEYRYHKPQLSIDEETKAFLNNLTDANIPIGVITDGRSISQRNKLKALGLQNIFTYVVISEEIGTEKPALANFKIYEDLYPNKNFFYIGDNTSKDFVTPNQLGWSTICLIDNGRNIHKQNFQLEKRYLPKICIDRIDQLKISISE